MTHTNHRRGSRQSLQGDYVILFMLDPPTKTQHTYGGPLKARVKKLLSICEKYHPVALSAKSGKERLRYYKGWEPRLDSGEHVGATLERVSACDELLDEGLGHAVYTSKDAVEGVLAELKEADLGISIVVSGIFDNVFECCKQAGLKPHTANMSLGTWGKTELMPEGSVLEIATMCGHAMVSVNLINTLIDRVRKGKMTKEDAAVEFGKQCTCTVFNPVRAAKIIEKAVKSS